jgi:rare lipoprotein A
VIRPPRAGNRVLHWHWGPMVLALSIAVLAACSTPKRSVYYQDDGPPDRVPADIASIPDATPRIEPINARNSRPYTALGRSYTPLAGDVPFRQRGLASWYGKQFHGNRTASGEIYDMFAMTAAHPTLPLPSYVRVTHVRNGRSVIVRVNDRGPFKHDRVIDLSYAAAAKLGIAGPGTGEVELERITSAQIASGEWRRGATATARAAESPAAAVSPLAAASAPAAAVPISASSGGGSNWSVQLGAFSQQANAEAFAARASALLGLVDAAELPAAQRAPRIESDQGLYRVLVGTLPDRPTALDLALQLERILGRPASLVVR